MKKIVFLAVASLTLSVSAYAQSESAQEIATALPTKSNTPHGFKGLFGLGLSNAKALAFDNVTVTAESGRKFTGSSQFDIDPAYSLEAGFQDVPAEGWGYSAFLTYEARTRVTGYNDKIGGEKFTGNFSQEPSLNLLTVSGNAVYSVDQFYFPVGLNMTFPDYSTKFSSGTTEGGLGYQLGAGMFAFENFAIDLVYKKRGFNLKEKIKDVTYNYGSGDLSGLSLQAHVMF